MVNEPRNLDPTAAPDYRDVEQVETIASFDGETIVDEQEGWTPADGFVDNHKVGVVRNARSAVNDQEKPPWA